MSWLLAMHCNHRPLFSTKELSGLPDMGYAIFSNKSHQSHVW